MEEYIKDIEYEIFIIEQSDDKPFNRGKLLNIGYKYVCDSGCDYFVFHDVDMLPEDVDYSYSDKPLHLATHLQENDYETTFFDYFGGVTMFTKEDFKTINGFSNEYWGWGFEDDDLLIRCLESDLAIDTEISNYNSDVTEFEAFKFLGDSKILLEGVGTNLLQDDFTISVLVKPNDIRLNENKEYDEIPIISIPGYNIGIFYNSFRRFFCQTYDVNKTPYSITSDIIGERWVHLTMVYEHPTMVDNNNKFNVSFYIDGNLLDTIQMDSEILQLSSDFIVIGASNNKPNNTSFFRGLISNIEIYDIALNSDEIVEIYNNPKKPKLRNFGNFKSAEFLYTQVLPELSNNNSCVNLSTEHSVTLDNISIIKLNQSFSTFQPKPFRRNGRFKSLQHKSNSSIGNSWIHSETRKNQLKYYNEVMENIDNFRIDGLNTLRYKLININDNTSHTIISVEL